MPHYLLLNQFYSPFIKYISQVIILHLEYSVHAYALRLRSPVIGTGSSRTAWFHMIGLLP